MKVKDLFESSLVNQKVDGKTVVYQVKHNSLRPGDPPMTVITKNGDSFTSYTRQISTGSWVRGDTVPSLESAKSQLKKASPYAEEVK